MSFHVHDLTIGPAGPQTPTVIAVHGITGNGLNWTLLAELLGERFGPGGVRLLAPDLRGRGDSSIGPGPLGLAVHVQDLYTLATSLPQPPLMLGHSMGAAVCALLAAKHPEAIRGLVLVDGGVNFPVPSGMGDGDIDQTLRVVLGPAMKRLERTFDSPTAYLDFVGEHQAVGPLLRGPDGDQVRRYLDHDVRPCAADPTKYASSCVLAAIRADGKDVLFHPALAGAVRQAVEQDVPIDFLWAPRGLFDEPQGLYDTERLKLLQVPDEVRVTKVPDTNHYSIVLSRPGLGPVIDAVARHLDR